MLSAYELVWAWYVASVGGMVALGWADATRTGQGPLPFVAVQLGLLGLAVGLPRLGASVAARRWLRGLVVLAGLPVAFTSLGMVLPGIHPEPFEWTWIAADRALFGTDPTVALQSWLGPLRTEVLQWCYASFYFVPVAAVLLAWRSGGGAAYGRALGRVQLGFLVSYAGYAIWPTLPPYRFLDHGGPVEGVWLTGPLHALLDGLEANRWDCFPSGHTMLTAVSLVVLWRESRRAFWVLLPLGVAIVFSTVALRYHYVVDVLGGLLLVPPTMWLARFLFDREAAAS